MFDNRKHDYVPRNPAQFNAFMQNLINYAGNNLAAWGHIPQARFNELTAVFTIFERA